MALTEFGEQLTDLTKKFLRKELGRDEFLREERERVRTAILRLSNVPKFRSYVCFLLHCRKQAQDNSIARSALKELYRYLILDEGEQGRAGRDERFEKHLREQYLLFESRDALPWSCGIRVRNGTDECWYAPVLLKGLPITTAPGFSGRVFMTSPRLQRQVLLDIWFGDASVKNTTDRGLKRCKSFVVELSKEVPANSFVSVRMELDESGCGDPCPESTNKISAPMRICLSEVRTGDNIGAKHWHLAFGKPAGTASGSSGHAAPWVGLEALMNQALHWLQGCEGGSEEEKKVVNWLYRAEQVMRKQDELWLRHVLDVLLVELRNQSERNTLWFSRALGDIVGHRHRVESQADSSHWEISQAILSDYEAWRERAADDDESVKNSDVIASLLRAVTADGDNVDDAATEFAHVVQTMVLGGVAEQAGHVVGLFVRAVGTTSEGPSSSAILLKSVTLLRDTFESFVRMESASISIEARRNFSAWIGSVTSNLDHGRSVEALTRLFDLLRRWPVIGAFVLRRGFLHSLESDSGASGSQQEIGDLVREQDGPKTSVESRIIEAFREMYPELREIHLRRLDAGYASDEERVFLSMLYGVLWSNEEQVAMALLAAGADGSIGEISGSRYSDQFTTLENVSDIVRRAWVARISPEVEYLVRNQDNASAPSERPPTITQDAPTAAPSESASVSTTPMLSAEPGQQNRDFDEDLLSLVPGERDWNSPVGDKV